MGVSVRIAPVENFNLRQWYKGAVGAGVAMAVAAFAAGSVPGQAISLGLVFVGWGEWVNHPFITKLHLNERGVPVAKVTGEVRRPKFFGLVLDALGALLIAAGLFKLGAALLA